MENTESVIEPIYDRVTNVLAPFTGIEFVDKNLLESAGDRGTRVHSHIEGYLKGFGFGDPDHIVKPYLESFEIFWEASKHVFRGGEIILEERMFCHDKKITGQADVIVKNAEGKTYLIDWKTSVVKSKSWDLQGAAYQYLCQRSGYHNVDAVMFVRLSKVGKKPSLSKAKDEDFKRNLSIFFKCLELYRFFDMKNTRQQRRK